jgi:N-acetylglutamate synthase-like GNAT family acetyltransferase
MTATAISPVQKTLVRLPFRQNAHAEIGGKIILPAATKGRLHKRMGPVMKINEKPVQLTTRSGLELKVRRARPDDAAALTDLFRSITQEDLRFRFLSGLNVIGADQIKAMTSSDSSNIESYLVFLADGTVVATGMLACDAAGERGEVAISVHGEHHDEGIGWTLLAFLAKRATDRGLSVIESIENRGNRAAIQVERDSGFVVQPLPGDATLVLVRKMLKPA